MRLSPLLHAVCNCGAFKEKSLSILYISPSWDGGRKKRALIVTLILPTLTIPTCRHMQCRLTHLCNNLQVDVLDFPVFGFNTVLFTNVQTVLSKVKECERGRGDLVRMVLSHILYLYIYRFSNQKRTLHVTQTGCRCATVGMRGLF